MPDSNQSELAALAAAIEGETSPDGVLDTMDGKGFALPPKPAPTPQASQEKESQARPPASQESGDSAAGEGGTKDEQQGEPKPLDELSLDDLLKHPKLGSTLQKWADKAAAAQVQSAVDRVRNETATSTRQQAEDEAFVRTLRSMSQDEVAEAIRDDADFAQRFLRYRDQSQSQNLDPQAVASASQVYALAAQVATYSQVIEESELPADVKSSLDANQFTHLGPDGVIAWGQAIIKALTDSHANKLMDEKWEAFKQEHLAEIDGNRPPIANGRRAPTNLDLMTTPSEMLLETALEKNSNKGK